jgi:hypothetical protein
MGYFCLKAKFPQQYKAFLDRSAGKPWLRLVLSLFLVAAALTVPSPCPVKAGNDPRVVKTTQTIMAHHWEACTMVDPLKCVQFIHQVSKVTYFAGCMHQL